MLRDIVWWALDTLCSHTAAVSSCTLTGDGETTSFTLPDNLYLPVETAGAVYTQTNNLDHYFVPARSSIMEMPCYQFVNRPPRNLRFMEAPRSGQIITVEYYAYYPHPYLDTDMIEAPSWSLPALSYLIAAHAMTTQEMSVSNIRQFVDQEDRGGPEDNPFLQQHKFFMGLYDKELSRYPYQKRELFTGIR